MNKIMDNKTQKILFIIFVIAVLIILLCLLQYAVYNRNHPSTSRIEWIGMGTLLLEDGSEYRERIPMKLYGFYFDYGMFYKNKNYLTLRADSAGDLPNNGHYYMEKMEDEPFSAAPEGEGSASCEEDYRYRPVYAEYKKRAVEFYFLCRRCFRNG